MSGSSRAQSPQQAEERQRLARELADLLDEVVFNVEHGIPWSVIHKLDAVGHKLEKLSEVDDAHFRARLKEEIAAFRQNLSDIFSDRDAAKELIDRGQRIASLLQEVR